MKMETKPAAPVAATEELPPEVSRFPRWKVLGALLLVVAAAAVAWWYMRGPAITQTWIDADNRRCGALMLERPAL